MNNYSNQEIKKILADDSNNNPFHKTIIPKEEEWGLFLKTLDELNIWGWKKNYYNPDVMDGCGFTLSVVTNKNKVRTEGTNDFPPNYFDFIRAFEKLVKEDVKEILYE